MSFGQVAATVVVSCLLLQFVTAKSNYSFDDRSCSEYFETSVITEKLSKFFDRFLSILDKNEHVFSTFKLTLSSTDYLLGKSVIGLWQDRIINQTVLQCQEEDEDSIKGHFTLLMNGTIKETFEACTKSKCYPVNFTYSQIIYDFRVLLNPFPDDFQLVELESVQPVDVAPSLEDSAHLSPGAPSFVKGLMKDYYGMTKYFQMPLRLVYDILQEALAESEEWPF